MARMNLGEIKSLIGNIISDSGTASLADIDRYVKMADRYVYLAHTWRERLARSWKETLAPTTGADGSISVGDTAFTSAAASFTSALIGSKLASAYGQPYYEITAVPGATSLTLGKAWRETAMDGDDAYVIFSDRVPLPSDYHSIHTIFVYDAETKYRLRERSPSMSAVNHQRSDTGAPYWYNREVDLSGAPRIQIGPYAPDVVYNVEILYWLDWSEPANDSADIACPERLEEAVIQRALYWAYQRDHFARAQHALGAANLLIQDAWGIEQDIEAEVTQIGGNPAVRAMDIVADFGSLEIP